MSRLTQQHRYVDIEGVYDLLPSALAAETATHGEPACHFWGLYMVIAKADALPERFAIVDHLNDAKTVLLVKDTDVRREIVINSATPSREGADTQQWFHTAAERDRDSILAAVRELALCCRAIVMVTSVPHLYAFSLACNGKVPAANGLVDAIGDAMSAYNAALAADVRAEVRARMAARAARDASPVRSPRKQPPTTQ